MASEELSEEQEKTLAPIVREIKLVDETRPTGEWMVNLAHYQGFPYAEWGTRYGKEGRLVLPKKRASEVRAVENRMMADIDKMVALVMDQLKPPQVVPPQNMSIAERNRVETANALSLWLAQPWNLDDNGSWEEFCRWLFLTGTACDWEHWDSKAGRKFRSVGTELYSEGGHVRDIISPFDVFPQPNVRSSRKMRRFRIRLLTTVSEIKRHYGIEVARTQGMTGVSAAEWQIRYLGSPRSAEPDSDAKYIYVHLERPSEEHPGGREIHFTMVADKAERLLYEGPNPNPNGELQVGMESYRPFGTSNWSASIASQLRLNGVTYNELLSDMIQAAKNSTRQIVMTPDDAKVNEGTFDERDKAQLSVITYSADGAGPPMPLQLPSPPASGFEVLRQLDKGREDMSHQHEAMRGGAPSQMRSQPGVQEIRETDLLPMQPLITRVKELYCEVCGWRLAMARRWFTEQRTAQVMNDANRWKAYDFHRTNLAKADRFFIPAEPNMPLSLSGKMQLLGQMQQIADPALVQALFADIVHVDRVESVASLERNHREAQRQEIEHLVRGEPVGVDYLDEDSIHMDEMSRYKNQDSELFDSLPPLVRAQFYDHYLAHKSQMVQKLIEQAELAPLQMAASGEAPQGAAGQGSEQGEVMEPEMAGAA